MNNYATGFPSSAADFSSLPIGSIINSVVDLESLTKGEWIALNGKDRSRGEVSSTIADNFPAGTFAVTTRTGSGNFSAGADIAASPTYFVAGSNSGVVGMQYSSDGVTWAQTGSTGVSGTVGGIGWIGTRFVVSKSTATSMAVSAGDNPAAAWTACSGSIPVVNEGSFFAYSPPLGLTAMLATTGQLFSLPDASTVVSARTSFAGLTCGVVWNNRDKFIVPVANANSCPNLYTSTDGITYTPNAATGFKIEGAVAIATNGAETIVIVCPYYLVVSKDYGDTWVKVYPPVEAHLAASGLFSAPIVPMRRIVYANGLFLVNFGTQTASGNTILLSRTGLTWQVDRPQDRYYSPPFGGVPNAVLNFPSYAGKTGVWAAACTSALTMVTMVENKTKFRTPASIRSTEITTADLANFSPYQEYMKVF